MSTTTEESQQPFSPFSDSSSVSDPTSDEHPDLGQFNFVFRTLTHLQPHPWIPAFNGIYPSEQSTARAHTVAAPEGSTVWQQLPILSYLDFASSELIIGPLQLTAADTPRTSSSSSSQSEDDDTVTVDISSNDGGLSIGGSPDSHSEEEEEDDGGGIQIPLRWQSPLRAYSPEWDSEENPDEFGPFDGATTASSGTRPIEDSVYNLSMYHPVVVYRDSTSTPSSVQDGPMSVTSLRTSPPTRSSTSSLPSFPAHDDNSYYSALSETYSLLERPASLPHVFSSPFNDNSTRSSYSACSSPPRIVAPFWLRSASPPSDSLEQDISHQQSHIVQPQSSIPHSHHHQHRSWTSGSASTSTITSASTTTRATHVVNDTAQVLTSTGLTLPAQTVGQDNNCSSASSTPTSLLEDSMQPRVYDLFMDLHSIRSYGTTGSDDGVGDDSLPSLGLLDEALKFIADERAKWEASRDTGNVSGSLSSDNERWKNELGSDSARESNVTKSSASDLNLLCLSPNSRKKNKKIKKMIKSGAGISGAATPIVSILLPDGRVVGGSTSSNVNRKRRSLESDGTLTPRMGAGTWTQVDQINVTPKKGKDKGLVRPRSVPQLKILTDPGAAAAADEQQQQQGRERDVQQVVAKRKHANVNIANAQTHAVNTKRARLQNLAKQLQGLFPDDKARLDYVLKSLQKQKLWKSKEKKEKHKMSESSGEDRIVFEDEDEELDPRGRPPRKGDPLVHVFIDHSNILFGLLTHLKRHPPRRPLPPTPANTNPVSSAPASPAGTDFTSIPSASTILPLPSFATARVRIPLEAEEHERHSTLAVQVDNAAIAKTTRHVRHLSHTALSLILERGRPVTRRVLVTSSPLYQPMDGMERLGYQVSVFLRVPDLGDGMDRIAERHSKDRHHHHHHHRETSINRTTLARSKTHSGISKSSSSGSGSTGPLAIVPSNKGASPRKNKKPRPLSGGSNGVGVGDGFRFGGRGGQQQQQQEGSDIAASAPSSYNGTPAGAFLHSAMLVRNGVGGGGGGVTGIDSSGAAAATAGGGTTGSTPHRIRFREQGVDELLQLKLHQALAAEDDVPEGATIVLATGDGNVGQFNEEGFLGPVRTALKRGWKVELYSWVGGLSRAWKREFGEDSEWGKSGKFRIIGMEQFATSLVEDGWVEV